MKTKLCEFCGVNEFKIKTSKKYCDNCLSVVNRNRQRKYAKKNGSGIYKILNKINNKIYIGQSRNLTKRLIEHKNTLMNNTHFNEHLQRSWNKYGEDNFEIAIIENCNIEDLYERENYWINFYNSYDSKYGYNVTIPPKDELYFGHSEESKKKMSESKRVFDDEELISYLQEYFYHFGKVPTSREISNTRGFPNGRIYFERFGSFKDALIKADLFEFVDNKYLFERKEYTKQDIIDKFKKFIEKNGSFPNHIELKNCLENDLPSFNIIRKYFSGMEELKELLGFNKDLIKEKENKLALQQLKKLYLKDGYVTSRTIDSSDITTHSAKFYIERFDSLMNAYELIGIYTKEHVTKELKEFYSIHRRVPSNDDIDTYKLPPRRIISIYYKTEELKQILGINKENENKLALESLKELYNKQGYVDQDSINTSKSTKSVKFYCSRFGSLKNACLEAKIPLDKLILKYG